MGTWILIIQIVSSPIGICILLIMQILTTRLISVWVGSLWLRLIFVLIFFGGLIVLFVYIRSVAQNDTIVFNTNRLWVIGPAGFMLFILPKRSISFSHKCLGQELLTPVSLSWGLILVLYLLIVLVIAVKLRRGYFGALRVD